MNLSIDDYVTNRLATAVSGGAALCDHDISDDPAVSNNQLWSLFDAQLAAREIDLYARTLQQDGDGFYTIGSLGHESNAAIALALRPTDPALLHYRSGGFFCARSQQVPEHDAVRDMILSLMASADDPISGGRHKVFGSKALSIIPQTSTIASHLPRAVGLAFAHDHAGASGWPTEWPDDAVVIASLGDASLNHSTAVGALNAAQHAAHQGTPLPLLVVIEDNGFGISVRSPAGWVDAAVGRLSGFARFTTDGAQPCETLRAAIDASEHVRRTRSPAVLHLRTVRFMGHAGSDAEIGYRSHAEINAEFARDPLLATASVLLTRGVADAARLADCVQAMKDRVRDTASQLRPPRRLSNAPDVARPLLWHDDDAVSAAARAAGPDRAAAFRGRLPESAGELTLAQTINATLTDLLAAHPQALVFGEAESVKSNETV